MVEETVVQPTTTSTMPEKAAAAAAEPEIPFTKPISWDDYTKCRPPYPPSLFHLWSSYHSGPLTTLHDVGAGGGVATHGLATHFPPTLNRIYVSDPGSTHLSFASEMLPLSHPSIRFSFHESPAEETSTNFIIPDGGLDFLSCCEALHWTDTLVTLPIFHKQLRRGGTFAAVYYLPYPEITNCAAAQEAMVRLLDGFALGTPEEMVKHPKWKLGLSQSNSGLDFIGFDDHNDDDQEKMWEGVRRIEINTAVTNGKLRKSRAVVERFGEAVNRLGEGEGKKEKWEDEGWKRYGVEGKELRELIQTSIGAGDEIWEGEAGREFVEAVEGVKLDLVWQVAVVMGRKR